MEISILIEEGFDECLDADWLEDVAIRALDIQGVSPATELSLAIVGQEKIRQLNKTYLGRDEPTDVLAFDMRSQHMSECGPSFITPPDSADYLGEVIISYPQATIQAEDQRYSVKNEVALLVIHGILHLLGYDHDKIGPEKEMRAREQAILSEIKEVLE